ncbi:protein GLUTAMINE DUMPER 3 [Neltuma alba]|uniref:protein GLUTAMINE DUMPER 3 n=1 Tax=Neltuma alba TaxID=207710 RepID=UPI0010A2DB82|nr:protein GLUTAMINE DUMPER 3 [Prosopis alba]
MAAYREPMNVGAKSPEPAQQHSPWHSPVPYLFGGLAAMLGLIAFALLILACSYWKLSGFLDESREGERDLEAGEAKLDGTQKPFAPVACEPKFLVIMPGQERPTCLATPAFSSRSSSFAGGSSSGTCTCDDSDRSGEMVATLKQENQSGSRDQEQPGNTATQNTSNDQNC